MRWATDRHRGHRVIAGREIIQIEASRRVAWICRIVRETALAK
jgi:hypothetical protein